MTARALPSQGLFSRILGKVLSKQNKRMIFLASLTAFIKDIHEPDAVMLAKINEMFSLSENNEALKFPMKVSPRIWGAFDLSDLQRIGVTENLSEVCNQRLGMSQKRMIARYVVKNTPAWLRYHSNRVMVDETVKLLNSTEKFEIVH